MLHIGFAPVRSDDCLTLSAAGDTLTLNGALLDLTAIPPGTILPQAAVACDWLAGDIEHRDDGFHLMLILPHGPDAPPAARFPQPVIVTADGPVPLPGAADPAPARHDPEPAA